MDDDRPYYNHLINSSDYNNLMNLYMKMDLIMNLTWDFQSDMSNEYGFDEGVYLEQTNNIVNRIDSCMKYMENNIIQNYVANANRFDSYYQRWKNKVSQYILRGEMHDGQFFCGKATIKKVEIDYNNNMELNVYVKIINYCSKSFDPEEFKEYYYNPASLDSVRVKTNYATDYQDLHFHINLADGESTNSLFKYDNWK